MTLAPLLALCTCVQGNIFVEGAYSVGEFYNCTWENMRATISSALYAQGSTSEEDAIKIKLIGCQFLRSSAPEQAAVFIGWLYVYAEIQDCLFENNGGIALLLYLSGDSEIARCQFRGNTGTGASWPGYGASVFITMASGKLAKISDTLFERNTGAPEFSGGALFGSRWRRCADG